MRDRAWRLLARVKYHSILCGLCSTSVRKWERGVSAFLALVSTASVATWVIWTRLPGLWATIVLVAQIIQAIKPYVTFLGCEKNYTTMSFELDRVYLCLRNLWHDIASGRIEDEEARKALIRYAEKAMDIERVYPVADPPRHRRMELEACKMRNDALAADFGISQENGDGKGNTATPGAKSTGSRQEDVETT